MASPRSTLRMTRPSARALIIVAEDDSALSRLSLSTAAIDQASIVALVEASRGPIRILLIGWNARARTVVAELENYAEPGSVLTVVADFGEPDLPDLRSLTATVERGCTTSRTVLDRHVSASPDHIIVLPYADDLPA